MYIDKILSMILFNARFCYISSLVKAKYSQTDYILLLNWKEYLAYRWILTRLMSLMPDFFINGHTKAKFSETEYGA